ncbi:hypothetical protein TNIN_151691, partial [Trichonephila inaurata madagascariensis]
MIQNFAIREILLFRRDHDFVNAAVGVS